MRSDIIEKYNVPFEYAGAFMNLILAYQFYKIWTSPAISDANKIADYAVLMGFEFIMVHSGVFMAVMPKKISLYVLLPVYGLFALAMNTFVSDNSVLIIYGIVVFNRMRFAFSDVSKKIQQKAIFNSVIAVLVYFVLVFVVAFNNEHIPLFGLTKEFLAEINYYENLKTGGLLLDEPQTAFSLGFLYYTILALMALWIA